MLHALLFTLFCLFAVPAFADTRVAQVFYPAEPCAEIVSQEYSTGGGNTSVQYLEILCRDEAGAYTGFVAKWSSTAGLLGLGRFTSIDRFDYAPRAGATELEILVQ